MKEDVAVAKRPDSVGEVDIRKGLIYLFIIYFHFKVEANESVILLLTISNFHSTTHKTAHFLPAQN